MSALHPMRKFCPACGRAMKLVSDETGRDKHYVCPYCDEDPLHDPAARRWVESPLKPPTDS
jgi:hypothetical protein